MPGPALQPAELAGAGCDVPACQPVPSSPASLGVTASIPGPWASFGISSSQPGLIRLAIVSLEPSGWTRSWFSSKISR
jgi:hypothetical protein